MVHSQTLTAIIATLIMISPLDLLASYAQVRGAGSIAPIPTHDPMMESQVSSGTGDLGLTNAYAEARRKGRAGTPTSAGAAKPSTFTIQNTPVVQNWQPTGGQVNTSAGNYPQMPGWDTFGIYDRMREVNSGKEMDHRTLWATPHREEPAQQQNYGEVTSGSDMANRLGYGAYFQPGSQPIYGGYIPAQPDATADNRKPFKLFDNADKFVNPAAQANNTSTIIINPNIPPSTPQENTGTGAGSGGNTYRQSMTSNKYQQLTNPPPINSGSLMEAAKNLGFGGLVDEKGNEDPNIVAKATERARADSTKMMDYTVIPSYLKDVRDIGASLDSITRGIGGGGVFPNGVLDEFYNQFVGPKSANPNLGNSIPEWIKRAAYGKRTGDPWWSQQYDKAVAFMGQVRTMLNNAANRGQLIGTGGNTAVQLQNAQNLVNQLSEKLLGQ